MKCTRCGFENPDYLEYCQNCSEPLHEKHEESSSPSWGFVKAPKWSDPVFSADSVSEDDVPSDFVSDFDAAREQRRAAEAAEAAERARAAADAAAAAAAAKAAAEKREAARRAQEEEARLQREEAARRAEAQRLAEEELAERERQSREALEAAKRSAEQKRRAEAEKLAGLDDEEEEAAPILGGIFGRKNRKPVEEIEEEEDYDDYEDDYRARRVKPARSSGKSKRDGMSTAIKIAAIIAALMLLAIAFLLIKGQVAKCSEANDTPTGVAKDPEIVPNAKEEDYYNVTVYAKEGKVLVYETADKRTRREVTVPADNALTFKVHKTSLLPDEPIDAPVYDATPTVYIKNEDGTLTPVPMMPTVRLEVPTIDVEYDIPDNLISENGIATISGHINLIATELLVNGEKVVINQDGSFSHDVIYEDTGDYVVEIEGRLPSYQVYRHSINVNVTKATPATPLVQLPWEYGDYEFSQRVKSSVDTIEVRGMVPIGSTLEASCESSNAAITIPVVGDDGVFKFNVKMAYPGDYKIHLVCTSESGQVSERDVHVQRAPEYSKYLNGAWQMNFASFAYNSSQAYQIKGTVTEILEEGDYVLATMELTDGNTIVIEYHNHYGSAGDIIVGKSYEKLYGRPLGLNEDGIPQVYIWFVED